MQYSPVLGELYHMCYLLHAKGLVINYGEWGATKWENRRSETFCATPSSQGKTFHAPLPFKERKLFAPPSPPTFNLAETSS